MRSLGQALIGLKVAGIVLGLLVLAGILSSDHTEDQAANALLTLLIGWSFIGTGLFAWYRRPASRIGPLMAAVGFTWLLSGLVFANPPGLFIAGFIIGSLPIAILVHMVLSFPSGRLEGRAARGLVGAAYFTTVVYVPIPHLFIDTTNPDVCEPNCPPNPLLVSDNLSLGETLFNVASIVGIVLLIGALWLAMRRWREADHESRRSLGPALWAALATMLAFVALLASSLTGPDPFADLVYLGALIPLASVPYAFLAGLLRLKLSAAEQTAEENVRLDAELQVRYQELRASRARLVDAADNARRRLERDLHDGAQQRLVGLALSLRLARERLESDPQAAGELLDEASAELALATDELRELARGIHPAILSDRGLGPALDALAKRSPVKVSMRHSLGGAGGESTRPATPPPVESAAYFVVAEGLTNVIRHAGSRVAEVNVVRRNGALHVEVTDSGSGGADPDGSGLRGLADRVQALDGELEVESEPGAGTAIHARIPIQPD